MRISDWSSDVCSSDLEFRLDVWLKDRKLRLEGIMQPNFPSHIASRLCCVNVRCGTSMPALRVSRSVKEFAEGCLTNPATSDDPIERSRSTRCPHGKGGRIRTEQRGPVRGRQQRRARG